MRVILLLLLAAGVSLASQNAFSVYDDLLAFPQYSIVFSDSVILDTDLPSYLSLSSSQAPTATPASDLSASTSSPPPASSQISSYQLLHLSRRPYLCSIPSLAPPPPPPSADEAAAAAAAEARSLSRAQTHGWELLGAMKGVCLYFISGYWSYEFCYGRTVRQFHQLPPGKNTPLFPPVPDPAAPSFVLGRAENSKAGTKKAEDDEEEEDIEETTSKEKKDSSSSSSSSSTTTKAIDPLNQADEASKKNWPANTALHTKGDVRYLSQTFLAGTECDLTGRPRKVEVQFHCHPHTTDDRIGWIKEVATCTYVLVVHTARLCDDAAFVPPKEDRANAIECRRVVSSEEEAAEREEGDSAEKAEVEEESEKEARPIIGGIEVGAQLLVGSEGKRLEAPTAVASSKKGTPQIIAQYDPVESESGYKRLTDKELSKRGVDPKAVEALRTELMDYKPGKAWKIELLELEDGLRKLQGVFDTSDEEGSEEELKEGEDGEHKKDL